MVTGILVKILFGNNDANLQANTYKPTTVGRIEFSSAANHTEYLTSRIDLACGERYHGCPHLWMYDVLGTRPVTLSMHVSEQLDISSFELGVTPGLVQRKTYSRR